MRQEARFVMAIALMILVLVGTNYLFPPIRPEEASAPAGEAPGQLDSSGVAGTPTIPLGGAAAPGGPYDVEEVDSCLVAHSVLLKRHALTVYVPA